jgi:hypothetical protein
MRRQTTSLRSVCNNNDQCQISVTAPLFTLKIVWRQRAIAHRRARAGIRRQPRVMRLCEDKIIKIKAETQGPQGG